MPLGGRPIPGSRERRLAIMADPRIKGFDRPYDGQRMIYGGFAPLLDQ